MVKSIFDQKRVSQLRNDDTMSKAAYAAQLKNGGTNSLVFTDPSQTTSTRVGRILDKYRMNRDTLTSFYSRKKLTKEQQAKLDETLAFESQKMVNRNTVEEKKVLYSSESMKLLLANDSKRLESQKRVIHNFKETGNGTDHVLSTKLRFRTYMPRAKYEEGVEDETMDCKALVRKTIKNLNNRKKH